MSKIIGIDLGTTFSAIAELDDLGNPEVLSDPEIITGLLVQLFILEGIKQLLVIRQ